MLLRARVPACLALVLALAAIGRADPLLSERTSLDQDWRFTKGDDAGVKDSLAYPKIKEWILASGTALDTPMSVRHARPEGEPGGQVAFAEPGFDDQAWTSLNLPHDWGIEGPFVQGYPGETGKLAWWGVAWYRKHLTIPASDQGRKVSLDLDGAMAYACVWVNGKFAGGWPYGYASFRVDLTPFLAFGGDNVIAIRLDNPPDSSRWYPGGGIYRHVWLSKSQPLHVAHWGTFITTPKVNADEATVSVDTTLENETPLEATLAVTTELFAQDAAGHPTGEALATTPEAQVKIYRGHDANTVRTVRVSRPALWSPSAPHLYTAVTSVRQKGALVDRTETTFGIRSVVFDANRGCLINGEALRIQGVCDHADLGALGTAVNRRGLERQVELLKQMGCNAIRTSHNPPDPELLELCDRMGIVVMDETFDCWQKGKKPNDYHLLFDDWSERDTRMLVRRDRNHPSVILWSIGNEVPDQMSADGWRIAAHLTAIVHEEDKTRLTTAACNHTESGYNGFETALGVLGYNYRYFEYANFKVVNPEVPMLGSETASTVSTRGFYAFPVVEDKAGGKADNQVSSYDLSAPPWATPPDWEFAAEDKNPAVAGEFVWTGFDYLGEPTPYNKDLTNLLNYSDPAARAKAAQELAALGHIPVPSRSSYFGILDLCGFKKDRFYLYQARWSPQTPMAHLLPHWTWPERVGQVTPVFVYTSGDEAELFLNGKSLGRKTRGPYEYRLRWDDVVYQPGELKVVAYRRGKKWAEDVQVTAGAPAALSAQADRTALAADGSDLAYITVSVRDAKGVLVPRADALVHFTLTGPGEIVGVDNGDPTSFESFKGHAHRAFNGLCLVIVRTKTGASGKIAVTATADGLSATSVELAAQ